MSKGAVTVVAAAMVPTTAMVATGHTWIAAGTIGAMFGSLLVLARIRTRAATEQHRETLSYAQTASTMGADAAEVINAMHDRPRRRHERDGDREHQSDRHHERDQRDREHPDSGPPGVHLPPRRR